MENFEKYLSDTKSALGYLEKFKTIHLVLGNESCDLDSTVAAIALAYLIKFKNPLKLVIPIMNIPRKYFSLRTESCYLLKQINVDAGQLVFKDEVNIQALLCNSNVKTSIVDHHVLAKDDKILEKTVVEIFDHRPINNKEIIQRPNVNKTIKTVGSCCTLVAEEIINSEPSILFPGLVQLLYSTIIYDTLGLNKEGGKTFDEDISVCSKLEEMVKPTQTRKELFDVLWKIHNDITNISIKDLLYRDIKLVQNIPVPGLPLLVEEYLKREDAYKAITEFFNEYQTHSVIIMGIDASHQVVKRDFAVYSTDSNFKNIFLKTVKSSKELFGSDLEVTEVPLTLPNTTLCRQGNHKLSRKFMIPLLTEAVRCYNEVCNK